VDRIPICLWRHFPDIDLDPTALTEARAQVPQALVGGLDECGAMITSTPEAVRAQVQDAVSQCRGRGLIVAPGCAVDLCVPEANLAVARAAVEDLGAS